SRLVPAPQPARDRALSTSGAARAGGGCARGPRQPGAGVQASPWPERERPGPGEPAFRGRPQPNRWDAVSPELPGSAAAVAGGEAAGPYTAPAWVAGRGAGRVRNDTR